jgi:chondroitin 4-sulfotransferase 11
MTYISFLEDNQPFVFIHIPKCAGSSVKSWYKEVFNNKVLILNHAPVKNFAINDFFKWTIVRNPFDRFISFYTFRGQILKKRQKTSETYYNELLDWEKGIEYWTDKWFDIFWFDDRNNNYMLGPIDNTFKLSTPQVEWLTYKDQLYINHIIKLENLEHDFKPIKEMVNTNIDLETKNRSKIKLDIKLNKKLKNKIRNYYKLDFELLDY